MGKETSAGKKPGNKRASVEFFAKDDGTGLPFLEASPKFIFAHHPKRWVVMAGKLVPSLSKIPLVDGSNQVSVAPNGAIKFNLTRSKFHDAGFKIIGHELAPDGETYLQDVDTRPGGGSNAGVAFISVWEEAHAGSSETVCDEEAYVEWLEGLVTGGHIAPCQPHVAAQMLERSKTALRDAEYKLLSGKLSDLGRVDALKLEVEVLAAVAGKGAKASARKSTAPKMED
jgi:hypothetical protein